jgi:hypothetical protein
MLNLLLCQKHAHLPKYLLYKILEYSHHNYYARLQISRKDWRIAAHISEKKMCKYLLRAYENSHDRDYLKYFNENVHLRSKYVAKYSRDPHLYETYRVNEKYLTKYVSTPLIKYLFNLGPDCFLFELQRKMRYSSDKILDWYERKHYHKFYTPTTIHKYIRKRQYELLRHPISAEPQFDKLFKLKRKHLCDPEYVRYMHEYLNCTQTINYYGFKYNMPHLIRDCGFCCVKAHYYAVKHNLTHLLIFDQMAYDLMAFHKERITAPFRHENTITFKKILGENLFFPYGEKYEKFVTLYCTDIRSPRVLTPYPSEFTYVELISPIEISDFQTVEEPQMPVYTENVYSNILNCGGRNNYDINDIECGMFNYTEVEDDKDTVELSEYLDNVKVKLFEDYEELKPIEFTETKSPIYDFEEFKEVGDFEKMLIENLHNINETRLIEIEEPDPVSFGENENSIGFIENNIPQNIVEQLKLDDFDTIEEYENMLNERNGKEDQYDFEKNDDGDKFSNEIKDTLCIIS